MLPLSAIDHLTDILNHLLHPNARSRNMRPILLGGVQSSFERDLVTIEEVPDRRRANLESIHAALVLLRTLVNPAVALVRAVEEPCYKGSIERPFGRGSGAATCSALVEACYLSCS